MEATRHFNAIYSADEVNTPPNAALLELVPNLVKRNENNALMQRITLAELKSIVEGMEKDKAPGPDRFNARFEKVCWEIVHKYLFKMVLRAQHCDRIGGSTNSAFLALIPK